MDVLVRSLYSSINIPNCHIEKSNLGTNILFFLLKYTAIKVMNGSKMACGTRAGVNEVKPEIII